MGLTAERAGALKAAGLDHVQLSFQDSTREVNDFLSHTKTFELKQRVAREIKAQGWPMVMNVVIHRLNIDHIDRIIGMAAELGAEYLELANTQYYSWAYLNRDQLLPTREQLRHAEAVTDRWRQKLGDRMRIFFVAPDYHEGTAKKCANGWGSTMMVVTPDGTALPCHTARMLPGLAFPNVREHGVREIWFDSEGFNRYRGTGWMKEPCASCDQRESRPRRLPLPGLPDRQRSGGGRPGVPQEPASRAGGGCGRARQRARARAADRLSRPCVVVALERSGRTYNRTLNPQRSTPACHRGERASSMWPCRGQPCSKTSGACSRVRCAHSPFYRCRRWSPRATPSRPPPRSKSPSST